MYKPQPMSSTWIFKWETTDAPIPEMEVPCYSRAAKDTALF